MTSPLQTFLTTNQFVSEADFLRAEEHAAREKCSIVHALEALGILSDDKVLSAFSKFYKVAPAKLENTDIPKSIIDLIPKELALKHRVLPLDRAGNNIVLAMDDPRNVAASDAIRFTCGFFPRPAYTTPQRLTEALEKYYGKSLDMSALAQNQDPNTPKTKSLKAERQDISEGDKSDGPIIKLVNQVLMQCLQRRASDIHIEPYETYLRIRLRIDGILHEIARPPIELKAQLTSRIKIISDLDIAETRLPQDGKINIKIAGHPVDFRVSTLPTVYGEKIVMRILDKNALKADMTQLGFDEEELKKFKDSIMQPFGMVLVTGPTGSGKTTTLYSALSELNQVSDNIMTAEDPVEYTIEGINQVNMKSEIGLNFASALKSFLRQDPDVIMVGEIRDLETAEIAIKAALTGHMVLSTLHTNSATETISRLLNMGVESFNLVSALTCVTAQRLMRRICEKCRVVDESITPQMMIDMGIDPRYANRVKAYKGAGCNACGNTGNKGRVAVHEVLKLNDPVREAILNGLAAMQIKKIAMANGMRTLRQSALNKMAMGISNAQEVMSTTTSDVDDSQKRAGAA